MREIFGDRIPENRDPADRIFFCVEGLRNFIKNSIEDTERVRARRRAKALMREAGVWEEKETFAQSKWCRLN